MTTERLARRYAQRIIQDAKRDARSELSISKGDWTRQGAAGAGLTDAALLDGVLTEQLLPRVHVSQLTAAQFVERFERPKRPVIIEGLLDDWPAQSQWTPKQLLKRFADVKFKVGSDDDGYPVRMKLKHYLLYLADAQHSRDDSPLYVFDGNFDDPRRAPPLGREYAAPACFTEDLFALAGDKRRPPHKWLVIGPARSGSGLHIDPLATHAWNAVLRGRKRWALFPPGTPCEARALLHRTVGNMLTGVLWHIRSLKTRRYSRLFRG
jgi:histone arginine demethylase JMJD6